MSETPFMPLWVSDFLGDTLDLEAKEIGAYMLLLMAMWQRKGELPADVKKLQRVARVGRDWPKIWASLEHYFTVDGDVIRNKRLSAELHKVDMKRRVNAHAGARGGRAKALKNKGSGLANATDSLKQPEPYPERDSSLPSLKGSSDHDTSNENTTDFDEPLTETRSGDGGGCGGQQAQHGGDTRAHPPEPPGAFSPDPETLPGGHLSTEEYVASLEAESYRRNAEFQLRAAGKTSRSAGPRDIWDEAADRVRAKGLGSSAKVFH